MAAVERPPFEAAAPRAEVERAEADRLAAPLPRLDVERFAPAVRRAAGERQLGDRDLVVGDVEGEVADQGREKVGHALLLAADLAGELGGLLVTDRLGERLDGPVGRDLLGLVLVLGPRVLEHALLLAGATHGVQRPLRDRRGALDGSLRGAGALGELLGPGERDRLGLAAELLDAPRDVAGVSLGLLEVLAQPLLVVGARRHDDVGLERDLEPPLGRVGLVEVLDELHVALGLGSHRMRPTPTRSSPPPEPPEQQVDRALELVERRVLDAADPARAVQPAVDLGVAAAVAAAQVGDEAVALVAQQRAALERRGLAARAPGAVRGAAGARGRGAPARRRAAPNSASCGATSAATGTNAGSLERSVSRALLGARRARRVVLGRRAQHVAQLALDLGGVRPQDRVGRAGRASSCSAGRPGSVRTKRPTIWRKISGVLAAVA